MTLRSVQSLRGALRGRTSLRSISGIYGANLLSVAIGAVAGVVTARVLGAAAKGEIAIAQAAVAILVFVVGLSVEQAFVFYAAKRRYPGLPRRAFASGLAMGAIATAVVALVALSTSWLPGEEDLYLISAASAPLAVSGLFGCSLLQGWGMFRAWNLVRLCAPAFYLAFLLLFALGELTPELACWAFSAGVAVFWGAAVLTVRVCRARVETDDDPADAAPPWRELVSYGARTHLGSIQNVINSRGDIVVMGFFASTTVVGRYSVAVSVVAPLAMIGPAVAGYVFPRISAAVHKVDMGRYLVIAAITTAPLAVAVTLAAVPLTPLLFGDEFDGLGLTIVVLALSMVPLTLTYVLVAWCRGVGRPEIPGYAELAALAAMMTGTPLLTRPLGEEGAALVSLLTYSVSFLSLYSFYTRRRRSDPGSTGPRQRGGRHRATTRVR